jgi:hypothetical protein
MLFASGCAVAETDHRDQPCERVQDGRSCKWVHGRLSAGNGTPHVRLWLIGTHHKLGMYSNRYGFLHDSQTLDNEGPELHFNLPNGSVDLFWTVYGDFKVCILEPQIQGHMQAACIAKASHIVAE